MYIGDEIDNWFRWNGKWGYCHAKIGVIGGVMIICFPVIFAVLFRSCMIVDVNFVIKSH